MPSWPLQDAKARFSELVDATLKKGPQIVTRRGVETVVVVPIEEWRRLQESARPTLTELLLERGPKFDNFEVPRRQWKSRTPPDFE
ncbi:MAG TPA: type II toxin-antitoxin system Phd/YefM family antitoxin [Terriglobales bacterium]|nr:type II toxin-antitoxin system Phd/YefM family antitoxin [Terriglobales bacterium]